MNEDKCKLIEEIATLLLNGQKENAESFITSFYPHKTYEISKRTYTLAQKMECFLRDGFIDRYTGKRLLNPGMLKVLSVYFPSAFPYDPHWKMTRTHIAYWELTPTVDHITPIAVGGEDSPKNWATTSMKNNSIKSNYTLEEINWVLYPSGSLKEWDGLTRVFVKLVENDKSLLNDSYIKSWYKISKSTLKTN